MPDGPVAATGLSSSAAPERLAGHRLLKFTLAGICCALAITACGGSSERPHSGGGQSGSLVSFGVCMRSHGVPNLPDPGSSGGGGGVSIVPTGINMSAPAFKAAWSACGRLLELGAHHGSSAQAAEQMLKFSECMRSHDVRGFPDPTATPPAGFSDPTAGPPAGNSGYSAVIRRGGVYLAIPNTINRASPSYRQAAAACRFTGVQLGGQL